MRNSFQVSILPGAWTYTADAELSLLASAEAQGIVLPSSCRNGSCRTCLAQLRSGAVKHLVAWPGLSVDEKREGWILPCVAVPLADVELEAPAARRLP